MKFRRNVAELRREIRRIKTMDERSARHSEEQAEPQSYVYPAQDLKLFRKLISKIINK